MLVVRAVVSAAGIALMAVAAWFTWVSTSTYALHFCGWPAHLGCGDGSPLWWLVPLGISGVAIIGAAALVGWTTADRHGLSALAIAMWTVLFPIVVLLNGPRTFGTQALLIDGAYVALVLVLVAVLGRAWFPDRGRVIAATLGVTALLFGGILATLPGHLADLAA